MDKAKFIGVLDKVKAKLSDTSVAFGGMFPEVQANMLGRIETMRSKLNTASDDNGVIKAIQDYSNSIQDSSSLQSVLEDKVLLGMLTEIQQVVARGIELINRNAVNLYPIIQLCLVDIGAVVMSFTSDEPAKQTFVREIGGLLRSGTANKTIALMLEATGNVYVILKSPPENIKDMVGMIKAGLEDFRIDISSGKPPKQAMDKYKDAMKLMNDEMLATLNNQALADTLKMVHALAKKIMDSPVSDNKAFPESFTYMRVMSELILNYSGENQDYFHSIGRAMVAYDVETGRGKLYKTIDNLIAKVKTAPDGAPEKMKMALLVSEKLLTEFKKSSATDFITAVKAHAEQMKTAAAQQTNPENPKLAQTARLAHGLVSSTIETIVESGSENYDVIFRGLAAVGAIFNSYNGNHSDYFNEIGQILIQGAREDPAIHGSLGATLGVVSNEPFHLEWQAIHRITSILHSMQHA